eukprot:scaffold1869_cov163-Ochromonas_danica.AAC.31
MRHRSSECQILRLSGLAWPDLACSGWTDCLGPRRRWDRERKVESKADATRCLVLSSLCSLSSCSS